MNIRSVTCLVNVDEPAEAAFRPAGKTAHAVREALSQAGYTVQSTRLAVPTLHTLLHDSDPLEFALAFAQGFHSAGFDYAALEVERNSLAPHIPDMIRATENLFVSLRIASHADGIDLDAARAAAGVIAALAQTTPNGFGNFYFAAAANVPPGVPFFPTAYHDGGPAQFALAVESADLAVKAFSDAPTLDAARTRLIESVEREGAHLARIAQEAAERTGMPFAGLDFSLAPYPVEERSLATAMERLTGVPFGAHGTVFAAALLTDCLRRAQFPRAGFSGLMLPVLEDWTLARRSQENRYTLDTLLLLSTVCGTGLDTIPLAGDTTPGAITMLLLDLAALSIRHNKPLTARLIPVPGLAAGEVTPFAFEYFANARAFGLPDEGVSRAIAETRQVRLSDSAHG